MTFIIAESDLDVLKYIYNNYKEDKWFVYSATLAGLVPLTDLIEKKFLVENKAATCTTVLDTILKRQFNERNRQFEKYIFLDSQTIMGDPQDVRKIKDILSRYQLEENFTINILFISQFVCVPMALQRLGEVVFFDLPNEDELKKISDHVVKKLELKKPQKPSPEIVNNLKGLTPFEVEQSYFQSFYIHRKIDLNFIRDFKKNAIAKTDLLSLSETNVSFSDIGGMENLKLWIQKSSGGWTVEGKKFGLPLLKGLLLVGLPGCGKAQPLDSVIYTPLGSKLMGDMEVGDLVCTPDGGIAEVCYITPQGKKEIYRIYFRDGATVECCEDHLWEIKIRDKRHRGDKFILPLKEFPSLKSKYNEKTSNISIRVPDRIEFEERKLFIDPYVMGAMIGNGSLGNEDDPKSRVVGFTSQEKSIVNKVRKEVKKFDCILRPVKDSSIQFTVSRIKGTGKKNKFKSQLEKYGLLGKKSINKHIPADYLFNSYKNRIKLLNGLMDTDGNVVQNGHGSEYSTSSEQLSIDFKELIESLGGICPITSREPHYTKSGKKVMCNTNYRCWPKVVFNPFSLKRKRNKYITRSKYRKLYRHIEKIIPIGRKEAQCIGLGLDSNENLYLTDSFVITHNSMIMKAMGNEWGLPVVDFDPSLIFSSRVGDSEQNMRRVLQIVENMSPCILAIDEIEKGLAGMQSSTFSDSGVTARVIRSFLIWMQDSTKPVFVVATANNISYLPPELINRFDETFFVNLPQSFERKDIFDIHIRRLGRDPNKINTGKLAELSKDLSGREVEQVLREGMYEAFHSGKELTTKIIIEILGKKTNLITTMAEQLKALLKWVGWDDIKKDGIRARFASPSESLDIGRVHNEIDEILKNVEGSLPEEQ
jgi:AAA+ superfamily predicted ATPase